MTGRPAPQIELSDASLGYAGRPVLRKVSWTIRRGSMTALVGPNGGGKSTLLKAIAGELRPLAGAIDRHGIEPGAIGYLPQSSDFDRQFPIQVKHVVAMGLWPKLGPFGNLRKKDAETVDDALAGVGLAGFGRNGIGELSGGELQRVLFARMMVLDASVILLDEPFVAIDRDTVSDLLAIVTGWHREGRTIVAALHDLDHVRSAFPEAMRIAGGTATLGSTAEILGVAGVVAPAVSAGSNARPGAVA
jgi:zinc/manganese transport system ATP-binding protein